jgi:hypothetical protein
VAVAVAVVRQMVPHFPPDDHTTPHIKSTAVAVDKDKNSPHAVRWAIDHLVISNPVILLIHVRHRSSTTPHRRYPLTNLN